MQHYAHCRKTKSTTSSFFKEDFHPFWTIYTQTTFPHFKPLVSLSTKKALTAVVADIILILLVKILQVLHIGINY